MRRLLRRVAGDERVDAVNAAQVHAVAVAEKSRAVQTAFLLHRPDEDDLMRERVRIDSTDCEQQCGGAGAVIAAASGDTGAEQSIGTFVGGDAEPFTNSARNEGRRIEPEPDR